MRTESLLGPFLHRDLPWPLLQTDHLYCLWSLQCTTQEVEKQATPVLIFFSSWVSGPHPNSSSIGYLSGLFTLPSVHASSLLFSQIFQYFSFHPLPPSELFVSNFRSAVLSLSFSPSLSSLKQWYPQYMLLSYSYFHTCIFSCGDAVCKGRHIKGYTPYFQRKYLCTAMSSQCLTFTSLVSHHLKQWYNAPSACTMHPIPTVSAVLGLGQHPILYS